MLDFFLDETKIPAGVKTGTQQGFTDSRDTLETWITSFTRYSGTAVWVGNADNSLVRDGRAGGFASANTTVRLMKRWMSAYHGVLRDRGLLTFPAGFDELRPSNVAFGPVLTATTEGGRRGGCNQKLEGWYRTDVDYGLGDCETVSVDRRSGGLASDETPEWARREAVVVRLPELRPDLAVRLARQFGLPVATNLRIPFAPSSSTEETPTPVVPPTQSVDSGRSTPTPPPATPTPPPVEPTVVPDEPGGPSAGATPASRQSGDGGSAR